jgi:hypothetical protein
VILHEGKSTLYAYASDPIAAFKSFNEWLFYYEIRQAGLVPPTHYGREQYRLAVDKGKYYWIDFAWEGYFLGAEIQGGTYKGIDGAGHGHGHGANARKDYIRHNTITTRTDWRLLYFSVDMLTPQMIRPVLSAAIYRAAHDWQ